MRLKPGTFVEEARALGIREQTLYPEGFKNFSECFYHPLIQKPYPQEAANQCIPFLFPDTRIQFIASIPVPKSMSFSGLGHASSPDVAARGLEAARKQIDVACTDGVLSKSDHILRIAVWHHAITGNDKIVDDAFLDHLVKENVKLGTARRCARRNVHDLINYLDRTKQIHVVVPVYFGTLFVQRPESTPNHYHVIKVSKDHSAARVFTRCNASGREDGTDGPSILGSEEHIRQTYYDISF